MPCTEMKDLEAIHGRYGERWRAAGASRSRSLLPLVVLTLETGARKNTVRTLQWKNIDFDAGCLRFGKDKTVAGSGRLIPLNQRTLGEF
jgi:integrase